MCRRIREVLIMCVMLSMAVWQCTATHVGTETGKDDSYQTEDDILRLLEEEEKRQESTEQEGQELETQSQQDLSRSDAEINQLKAELLLKSKEALVLLDEWNR